MDDRKQAIRDRIWSLLEERRVAAFPGARGRIPNFVGASAAADRLAGLDEWRSARTIKCNPDAPQRYVRLRALREGKIVYMAVPRLRQERCFWELDPRRLRDLRAAASIGGAAKAGRPVDPRDLPHIDLVVAGSVAVSRPGARLGKGGGYSDLEYALCRTVGCIDDRTRIATTVHPLQILRGAVPETDHDFRVDLIVTADLVLRPRRSRPQPRGIIAAHLTEEIRENVPVLRALSLVSGS
ncbi:MAG: 5-formyltetrahydrofolate cyclo-ligase [Deltaproteobacteria bacterium]|nr:MAG: 5-formyltetrahydrofolate cyclo-ligase [Deltaproteobacteria bacterium]